MYIYIYIYAEYKCMYIKLVMGGFGAGNKKCEQ